MILAAAMESIDFYFIIWEISMVIIFAYIPILLLLGLARLCRNNCCQLEIIAAGWLIILAGIIIFFYFPRNNYLRYALMFEFSVLAAPSGPLVILVTKRKPRLSRAIAILVLFPIAIPFALLFLARLTA